jgi:hypothetical protein
MIQSAGQTMNNPNSVLIAFQFDNLTVYDFDVVVVMKHLRTIFERAAVLIPIESKIIIDTVAALGFEPIPLQQYPPPLDLEKKRSIVSETFYSDPFFAQLRTAGLEFLEYAVLDRLGYIMISKFDPPVDLSTYDSLVVIGGASSCYNFAYAVIEAARAQKVPVWGYPLGDLCSRLAPFWQHFCDKVFVQADQGKPATTSAASSRIATYRAPPFKPNLFSSQEVGDFVMLDACPVPIPNPQLFKTLELLEDHDLVFDLVLHVDDSEGERLYDILLNKRLRKTKVRFVPISSYFDDLAAAKLIISFGPVYRASRFLRYTDIKKKIITVDYHRRFELIDGIGFGDLDVWKVSTDVELIERVRGAELGVFQ